jgi:hypothetical protein
MPMSPRRFLAASLALATATLFTGTAEAAFHFWAIAEVYSSANGDVQFIELITSSPSETQANGAEIRTDSGNTFTITANLSGSTAGDRLLFATAGFYSLPGAPAVSATQPAYTLPADFFNPTSDRIRLYSPIFDEFHVRTISAASPVPTDNVFSRQYLPTAGLVANSPQARDVSAGSINRGDYNSDGLMDAAEYPIWRKLFGGSVSPAGKFADGNTNGIIDDADYTLWTTRFGNEIIGDGIGSGGGSAVAPGEVPEPATAVLLLIGHAVGYWWRVRVGRSKEWRHEYR